jgi:hypothetical protein
MQPTVSTELGERAQRRIALVFSAALALGGTALLVFTPALIPGMREEVPYYRSPAFFPMAALALLAVGAALHALRLLRGASLEGDDIDEPAANWRMVLLAGAAYAGYIALVPLVGYVAGTACFLFGLGLLARLGWKLPLVVATVLTAALFGVFVFGLNVWFPAASLAIAH